MTPPPRCARPPPGGDASGPAEPVPPHPGWGHFAPVAPETMQRLLQMAFDFLGGPEPVGAPAPELAPRPQREAVSAPAEPMAQVFQPGTWHHPRANRTVRLDSCEVAYEFKRGKRRTIGLSVGPDGLSVSAPRWTPLGEVDALLEAITRWVLDEHDTTGSADLGHPVA